MDRVLLGKSEEGEVGLWVSKPGINVIAFAGNSYFDDAYGFNENFNWRGDETFTYNWVRKGVDEYPWVSTSANGTLLLNTNSAGFVNPDFFGDPFFVHVMNANPTFAGGYSSFHRPHNVDTSFHGQTYPLFEVRFRRPPRSDGSHWTGEDYNFLNDNYIFHWFYLKWLQSYF